LDARWAGAPYGVPTDSLNKTPRPGVWKAGHELLIIEGGHSDTDKTTVLHVPSIGLVFEGDVNTLPLSRFDFRKLGGGVVVQYVIRIVAQRLRPEPITGHHAIERAPIDIQDGSRAKHVASRRGEHVADVSLLDLFQGRALVEYHG